jgi:hypothetical protein
MLPAREGVVLEKFEATRRSILLVAGRMRWWTSAGLELERRGVSSKSSTSGSSSESIVSEPSSSTAEYARALRFDPGTLSLRERAKGRCIACIEDASRSADKRCYMTRRVHDGNLLTLCRLVVVVVA